MAPHLMSRLPTIWRFTALIAPQGLGWVLEYIGCGRLGKETLWGALTHVRSDVPLQLFWYSYVSACNPHAYPVSKPNRYKGSFSPGKNSHTSN